MTRTSPTLDLHHSGRHRVLADGGQLTEFRIGRGDTEPALEATLYDAAGEPLDLSDALSVRLLLWPAGGSKTDPAVDERAEIVDAEAGHVRHTWNRGETETAGIRSGAFRVHYPDRGRLTVPNDSAFTVIITDP